jgi:predicted dehydrogenase
MADASQIELRSICDLDEQRLQKARRTHDVDTYTSTERLLDRDGIEAVAVITPAASHAEVSIRAMEAGKHVLCTKPLASSVVEAAQMVAAARRTGCKGAVDFQNRFRPCYWAMKDASEQLDPVQVFLTNQRSILRDQYLQPGYAYGILDSAAHRIDLVNWLVGHTPTAVSGSLRYATFTPEEAIDVMTVDIEYTDGRMGSVTASMGGSGLREVCQVVGKSGNAQRISEEEVAVREVSFSEEDRAQKDRQRVSEPRTVDADLPGESPTTAMMDGFAEYIRGGASNPGIATFEDGWDALLVAKGAVESHEKGEKIHLADLREELSYRS